MDHINDNCGPRHQQILYEFRLQEFNPSTGHFSAVASTGGSLHSNQVQTHLFRGFADFHRMVVVNVTSVVLPREQVRRTSASTTEQLPKQNDKAVGFNNGSQGESVTPARVHFGHAKFSTRLSLFLVRIQTCDVNGLVVNCEWRDDESHTYFSALCLPKPSLNTACLFRAFYLKWGFSGFI